MEEGGMTDYQFKCYTRLLLRIVEDIKAQDTLEGMREKLECFCHELEVDLQG